MLCLPTNTQLVPRTHWTHSYSNQFGQNDSCFWLAWQVEQPRVCVCVCEREREPVEQWVSMFSLGYMYMTLVPVLMLKTWILWVSCTCTPAQAAARVTQCCITSLPAYMTQKRPRLAASCIFHGFSSVLAPLTQTHTHTHTGWAAWTHTRTRVLLRGQTNTRVV